MKPSKKVVSMIAAAMCALTAGAQTTPFNSSAASPCPEVLIEQKYDHVGNARYRSMGWDTAVTCAQRQIELVAEPYIPVQRFNGTYLVEEVPYNPPDPSFHMGQNLGIGSDDVWAGSPTNIPYPFYFFGYRKNFFTVGGNGIVTFASGASGGCAWSYSAPLPWPDGTSGAPSGGATMRDAIYGVYQDTHPTSSTVTGNQGIYYGVQDAWPCRKIICSWNEIPQYSNQTNNRQTYQIVCYEGSNIIEVHIKRRAPNMSWNSGNGLLGIQNATGQTQVTQNTDPSQPSYFINANSPAYFAPSGWNLATTLTVTDKAYRFTPQGTTNMTYEWFRLMDNGDSIKLSTNPTDTNGYYIAMNANDPDHPTRTRAIISPNTSSRYVMRLSFKNANGDWYHLFDTCYVGVDTSNTLQLTANTADSASFDRRVFNICQGETTQLPLSYTNIQKPETINWTIKRILNGTEIDLDPSMVQFTDNDTAFTLLPDPNFEDLPTNKIDSIYVRASVDFTNGCANYDTILVRIFPNFDTIDYEGICRGETFHWVHDGRDYTESTTSPQVTKTSQAGCDSVVHLNLTVFDVSTTIDHVNDCKPITWINGKTYTASNAATASQDTIRLVNRYGCDSIVQLDFVIYPLTAQIKSSLTYFDYDHLDVELTDVSTGGNARVWHFPTGIDQTAAVAYYSIPAALDEADILMVAQSPYGCIDSTNIVIPFRKETFWVPNAFMPDDPTGNNTFGSVSTKTIQQEMYIYNRTGEQVFHCEGVDCQWDGRDLKGQPCPQGAYAYIIRYTNEYEPNVTKIHKGTVTLIR